MSARDSGRIQLRPLATCELTPRKYQRHTSRIGGTSGGLGRGARGFFTKIKYQPETECWEWIGYLDKDGYGKFTTTIKLGGSHYDKPRTLRPHRALWEYLRGPIPAGLVLMHRCDNERCVNPAHLRPATQAENIHDCYAKGRHQERPDTRGEMSGRAILTDDAVREIRAWRGVYGAGPLLSRLYGVSTVTISGVMRGRSWRHVSTRAGPKERMSLALLRELVAQRGAA